MKRDRSGRKTKSAADLLSELNADPNYTVRMRQLQRGQSENAARHREAAKPILVELAAGGISVPSLSDLILLTPHEYKAALPTLIRWLPLVENAQVKEEIARVLSVPWAAPTAVPALIAEFSTPAAESSDSLRWAIANALAVTADDAVGEQIALLAGDARNGKAREMLVLALGNCRESRVAHALIALLSDEQVVGHAVMALGKLKSKAARSPIERLLLHRKGWVRAEAAKAIAAIDGVLGVTD